MKAIVIASMAAALTLAPAAMADEALAKSSGCLTCHNVEGAKKMGASLKDIGGKYKGQADAEATLVGKMANKPHPAIKADAEAQKKLAKYILSL